MKKIRLLDSRIHVSADEMKSMKASSPADKTRGWDPDDFEYNCTGICKDGTKISCNHNVDYCMKQEWEDGFSSGTYLGAIKCGDSDWVRCPGFDPAIPSGTL